MNQQLEKLIHQRKVEGRNLFIKILEILGNNINYKYKTLSIQYDSYKHYLTVKHNDNTILLMINNSEVEIYRPDIPNWLDIITEIYNIELPKIEARKLEEEMKKKNELLNRWGIIV